MDSLKEVVAILHELANPVFKKGYIRFGVPDDQALGIRNPDLHQLGKQIGKDHTLALALWDCGIHEAKTLAGTVADPAKLTEVQMEEWVKQIYSWDICDNTCHLFAQTSIAYKKAIEWTGRDEEFVKRAGFVLMATLAIHDKKARDKKIEVFFPYLEKHAWDDRNFVKKAINWALRQIGKRSLYLHPLAIQCAMNIKDQGTGSAKWIANDALRELNSPAVINRLNKTNLKVR